MNLLRNWLTFSNLKAYIHRCGVRMMCKWSTFHGAPTVEFRGVARANVVNLGLYFCARTIASEQAMASEPVKVDSPSQDLTEDHLKILHDILYEVRSKNRSFGVQIGLPVSDIDGAESKYADPGDRLLEILILRVKKQILLNGPMLMMR